MNLQKQTGQWMIAMIISQAAIWCIQSEIVDAQPIACRLFANGWFDPDGRPCTPPRAFPPVSPPVAVFEPLTVAPPMGAPLDSAEQIVVVPVGPPAGSSTGGPPMGILPGAPPMGVPNSTIRNFGF
jgi:hypothetical protein